MHKNKYFTKIFSIAFFAIAFLAFSVTPTGATCPSTLNKSLVTVVGGDTCTVPASSTYVIDVATGENSNVTTGMANNGGSLTVNNTGTLRVGNITLGGGTLSVATGATVTAGVPTWLTDVDADNWALNFTIVTATASGKRRLGLMSSLSTVDCNDAAKSYTNTCYSYSQSAYYGYGQGSYYFYSQSSYYGYGQSGYFSGCFTADTKVLMADGTYKAIADVRPGENVMSYNTETKTMTVNPVGKLLIHPSIPGNDELMLVNSDLRVTTNHNVWSPSRKIWLRADKLNVGDTLLDTNGNETPIKSIEFLGKPNIKVYNLSLNGQEHNYFAGGYLVHNVWKQ